MKTTPIIFSLAMLILLFNCSNSSPDDVNNPDQNPNPSSKVTYNQTISSIMSSNCISCHGTTPSNNAPNSLTTYTQVKNNVDNIIDRVNRTGAGKMPPNSNLSASAKQLIQQWKNDGLLEN